jgi:hypothetical protein
MADSAESDHEDKASDKSLNRGGRPWRSKLLPYAAAIARYQRDGKTYEQIAALLLSDHGVSAHPDTINSFVLVRIKARKRRILPADYLVVRETAGRSERPTPAKRSYTVRPNSSESAARVVGTDGKEIRNAQYAPVNPDEL